MAQQHQPPGQKRGALYYFVLLILAGGVGFVFLHGKELLPFAIKEIKESTAGAAERFAADLRTNKSKLGARSQPASAGGNRGSGSAQVK